MKNNIINISSEFLNLKELHHSCTWAFNFLIDTLKKNNLIKIDDKNNSYLYNIYIATKDSDLTRLFNVTKSLPLVKESFAIIPIQKNNNKILLLYGFDSRGLVYAITEIIDRLKYLSNDENLFNLINEIIIEKPTTQIRSISKCFESYVEDLDWFYDRDMWREYLTMLITNRFNRITFTTGMQYNYPYGNEFIKDVYLYLAYPFLVSPKGYKIYAKGLSKSEQYKNLQTLKFISKEAVKRGLDFQLAIWTQRYDFDEVPDANYQIKNIPLNYAEYCRDSLSLILRECPDISGITLRVHVECGIPERSYDFWKTYFEAISKVDRVVELDLHAKGIDQKLINLALNATSKVNISPKYISEHMGLPYHQTSIRKKEMPPKSKVDKKWTFSEGTRKFLRYSYGDLLKEGRKYGILYRIWPGTQRILLWGDPKLAGGYGNLSTFCGSLGVELCEPLSFKGRMGTGIKGGRYNYLSKKLQTKYDWQKYEYTYRIWGRLTFNPNTSADNYLRYMNKHFGKFGTDISIALSNASRILPLITLAHGVSASNNSYWPEIYENMSIVHKAPHLPYSYDLQKPSRFGMSTSCDPQLFMSPKELADKLIKKEIIDRYSPLTIANWLENFSNKAFQRLKKIKLEINKTKNNIFTRFYVDIVIQASIGKFFAYKFRSAVFWEFFLLSNNLRIGKKALMSYNKARNAWKIASDISRNIYLPDLTYGPQSWLRGRWDDRLPAIEEDIVDMKNILLLSKIKNKNDHKIDCLINKMTRWKISQNIKTKHFCPKKFILGNRIILSCKINKKKITKGFLHYRKVNQLEKWHKQQINLKNNNFIGIIPSGYTNTNYPLQYYFEFNDKNISFFAPGFNNSLSNQPYYTLRNN